MGFTEEREVLGDSEKENVFEEALNAREEREKQEELAEYRERTVKVITVNDFERVVGV